MVKNNIEIIAHRGVWKTLKEKNSFISFRQALSRGFGIETDLRDYKGEIVISHDIPEKDSQPLSNLLKEYNFHIKKSKDDSKSFLALNIKSDGLYKKIKKLLKDFRIKNYFVFDMSIPDTLCYQKAEINFFLRHSEYEIPSASFKNYDGIWLDSFKRNWFEKKTIENYLKQNKKVCVVSPELHSRDHLSCWKLLKEINLHKKGSILFLCTDYPEEAKTFFYE